MRKFLLLLFVALPLLVTPAEALPKKNRSWTGNMGIGYTVPNDVIDELMASGFNLAVGATWKPRRSPVGLWTGLGYNGWDVNGRTLDSIGVMNGDLRIWSITGGVVWPIETKKAVDVEFSAGFGFYRVQVELLNPSFDIVPPGCFSWWGWCQGPVTVPVADVVGSADSIRTGWDIGMAISFTLHNQSEIYIQAKFHRINTKEKTEFIPITVGYRW
jgi:hypothetical protein